ncbi:MAG: hypothetical protein ACI4UX_02050 [Clostridia bacterium]
MVNTANFTSKARHYKRIIPKKLDRSFPIVKASELSLDDDFLDYNPESISQKVFKEGIEGAIKDGVKDFRKPVIDPSIDEKGRIFFKMGSQPAIGKSAIWWEKNAKKYMPQKNSRLGTLNEYYAFLAILIKELISTGWKKSEAWLAVCDDSVDLGHFCNSKNTKGDFELTGNRKVILWYDLANTYKILGNSYTGFFLASGTYFASSREYPLADIELTFSNMNIPRNGGVGWIVLNK